MQLSQPSEPINKPKEAAKFPFQRSNDLPRQSHEYWVRTSIFKYSANTKPPNPQQLPDLAELMSQANSVAAHVSSVITDVRATWDRLYEGLNSARQRRQDPVRLLRGPRRERRTPISPSGANTTPQARFYDSTLPTRLVPDRDSTTRAAPALPHLV